MSLETLQTRYVISEDENYEEEQAEVSRKEKATPGVGTDIFVRKKQPGSHVGKGYIVDIYESGVKKDSLELSTRKEVTKLIKRFKERYHTDRAFQNELQVHVTFKTKKERGDTMASIDNILLKKANKIQDLLYRVKDPSLPLVKRAQDELFNDISSVPETPATGTEDKEKIKRYIADEINKKFTSFVSEKAETEAIDDLFNPLRRWYATLSDKIREWNNMSNDMLAQDDIREIIDQTQDILLSKDPELISKNTGVVISQEVADLMYDVGTKSIGKPGEAEKGGELGGNPTDFKESKVIQFPKIDKIAEENTNEEPIIKTTNELLDSFTKQIQTQGNTVALQDIAKDLNIVDIDILEEMHSLLSEKSELVESESAVKKYIEDELDLKKKSSLHPSIIESTVHAFWKYASTTKGEHLIENVFSDWISKNKNLSKLERSIIWNHIVYDIKEAFGIIPNKKKHARLSEGDIQIAYDNFINELYKYVIEIHNEAGLQSTNEQTLQNVVNYAANSAMYPTIYELLERAVKQGITSADEIYKYGMDQLTDAAIKNLAEMHTRIIKENLDEFIAHNSELLDTTKNRIINYINSQQFINFIVKSVDMAIRNAINNLDSEIHSIAQQLATTE